MRSTLILITTVANADHFRAVAYQVSQAANGLVEINRSLSWRRRYSYYPLPGCTQSHIDQQTVSMTIPRNEYCKTDSGKECGRFAPQYIVTNLEDKLGDPNDYCYGHKNQLITAPTEPYTITWDNCCWVRFTTDDNRLVRGGEYGFSVSIRDPSNNTPSVTLPPMWKLLSGCSNQTIQLDPIDPDGDVVKCRFGTATEARGAYKGNRFDSISIDEDRCVITYNGAVDKATSGVKPIAVMVEDFDSFGKLRSSVPVQFLAVIWTPNTNGFLRGNTSVDRPYIYSPFFNTDLDDGDDDDSTRRHSRDTTSPDYCNKRPVLIPPSPTEGVINVPLNGTRIDVKAKSDFGRITRFMFNFPIGMNCSDSNDMGEASCTFLPNSNQLGESHHFCVSADDTVGFSSERRCVSLKVAKQVEQSDIWSVIKYQIPAQQNQLKDYGCTGVANLDVNAAAFGSPVDEIDRAINIRKHCVLCAMQHFNTLYSKYSFNLSTSSCGM